MGTIEHRCRSYVCTKWSITTRGIENLVNGFQVKPATKDPDNQDLIKQLYEQIGQLSVERDWLKKKSALFGLGN